MEQRKLHRSLLSRVRRRSQNVVARQHDDEVRSNPVGQDRIRHRVTMRLSVSGSARRRLLGAGEHEQRGGGQPPGFRQPVTPPPGGGATGEARGQRERMQGAHGQPPPPQQHQQPQQRQQGGAPAPADHGQGHGQPEGGKKKQKNQHHRRGHNNFGAITPAAPDEKTPEPLFLALPLVGRLCQTPILSIRHQQNLFDMATVSSAWPNQREPDSLECNSIFRGLIQTFEEDGQSRPVAIAIFHAGHTIR